MTEERRLVTVLFADVVGSTALGESLDPEDVRALLSQLFTIARGAVEQHGGQVEKYIGDAIFAVFGLPIAHDDDPGRALAAALDLRDRVRADGALSEHIAIRLGVNSGEVVAARETEAQQFLVTGDAVNTAARLQSAADPWAILVGERTARAAGDRFAFGPPIAVEAKGKARPIGARLLLGQAATVRRPARHRKIVGRQADLLQLDLAARRAFGERRPFLVSIVSPAGVGKSRLLEEFLGGLDPSSLVAVAQCLPYGQRLTYWPMRAILLAILGLSDDVPPEELRLRLRAWLRDAGDADPDPTADQLAATVGAGDVETADRLALFAAWRHLVELAAERSPLVLVIEDLHWSSDSLLDLIEAILQPHADVPLLMIALARPELLDRRPSWGGGRRNAVSIALEPLPEAAVAELVRDLLDLPSPEIVAAVVARADGNPFYAGEIVRSISDQIGPTLSAAEIAAAIAALPDTVHGTVLARLDGLEPTARRVVQLGSVLGRSFESRAIPPLDPELTDGQVETAIEMLIDRDFLRPSGRNWLTFRHILLREVAYGTLPRSERARLHRAAGEWLDAEARTRGRENELAELVAFHLREAVGLARLLGKPPSPELMAMAGEWLRRAADVADAGAATPEAARHLNAAIELAIGTEQPALYERLGEIWVGGEQGFAAFERAYELGRELGEGTDQELRTLAQAVITQARWIGSIGARLDLELRDRRLEEITRLLDGDVSDRTRALGRLALSFSATMVPRRISPHAHASAVADAKEALTIAHRLGDPNLASEALDALTAVALSDDRPAEGLPWITERQSMADRVTTSERVDTWNMSAWVHLLHGDLRTAEQDAVRARSGLGEGQGASWKLGATAWRIEALHALGEWDQALAEAERIERLWQESEIRAPGFAFGAFLAVLAINRARGDPVGVERWESAVRGILDRADDGHRIHRLEAYVRADLAALETDVVMAAPVFTARLDYLGLVLTLLADRRYAASPSVLGDLIIYAEDRLLGFVAGQARRVRGIVARDPADLRVALAAFETMGARPSLARVKTELGVLMGDEGLAAEGLSELESLGDVEHGARVATEVANGRLLSKPDPGRATPT